MKESYRQLHRRLAAIFLKHDLLGIGPDGPRDEYDSWVHRLLSAGNGDWLAAYLKENCGITPRPERLQPLLRELEQELQKQ